MRRIALIFATLSFPLALPAHAQRSTPIQLLQPSGAANDNFGSAVAIDGDTMIVGVPFEDVGANTDQGSAHIYRWTGSGWALEATLAAADGAASDSFGTSVAINGDTAIVGARADNVGANADQGSAYVFVRSGTTWTQQAQLNAAGGAAGDLFGFSVALGSAGDTAIIGAHQDDVGANANQGSAFIFARSGTTWTQQAQLTAADGAPSDQFGYSVALGGVGDTAIIGARTDDVAGLGDQGSAYVFVRSGATWTLQAQLSAADGDVADNFGSSVALSGDTAIIGARMDDVGANADQGSAFVFVRSGTIWTQQAQLIATGGAASDQLGISVALSGQTAIVGAYRDDWGASANQGSAFVFVRSGTTWTQQAQLTAADGAPNDSFGQAVALSGDTAIVGAPTDDVGDMTDQGSAWVFSRVGSTWIGPDLKLLASDGAAFDDFGVSVALSGETAIIGAPRDDLSTNAEQGSAYVFIRSGTTWTQQAKLTATDGAPSDEFGTSVALSGETAIIGAPRDNVSTNAEQGSAYVFIRSGTTWTQQAKLTASDGAPSDEFGTSVALSGDTALIGAYRDDVGGNNLDQGSAYVFTRSGTTWTQQAKLTASDGAAFDWFGFSVALSGDTALIGAYLDDVGGLSAQGSAYVFTRSGTTWTQQARLTATDGAANDQFGRSVAFSGNTALVGAWRDDVGSQGSEGSAYVFIRSGTTWTQQARLSAADGELGDFFGASVALSGDTAIVGAWHDNVGANANQGSAYVFTRSPGGTTWTQQTKLTASDGAADDEFGRTVALSGDTALVGACGDDVGANSRQGSAWLFDASTGDPSAAHNESTNISYATLGAALTAATSGQQISVSEAAWRTATSIDTAGRSLSLRGSGDVRTPSDCAVTLGGFSTLTTPAESVVDIFGTLSVPGSQFGAVATDSFRLGSRGNLRLFTHAQLTIDAPQATFDAPAQIDSRASLNLRGDAEVYGDLTAGLYSDISALGSLTNFGAWSVTSGAIAATTFTNRASLGVLGTSGIFGDFTNDVGAITTITSGRLFVVGTLTNNGTINGTVCSGCGGGPPALDTDGDLHLGAAAGLLMPFDNAQVRVGGDFNCAITSNTRYDMSLATLQLEGTGDEQDLEVMSTDIGPDEAGLDRAIAGHYPIGVLRIGPSPSTVRLVDGHDNDGVGQGSCEAIYVRDLRIEAGSRLINPACVIYYDTLVNNGTVDVPANLVQIQRCAADFDGDGFVTGLDFDMYVQAFETGDPAADFDGDGFVSGIDFDLYVVAFEAGC